MIDLWFLGLMLIPTAEVLLHSIGYLARIKLKEAKSNQFEPESMKISVNSKVTTVTKHTPNSPPSSKDFWNKIITPYPYNPPSKDFWKKILKDSKNERSGKYLGKITKIFTIALGIFFVIFVVAFICLGLLLKYNHI